MRKRRSSNAVIPVLLILVALCGGIAFVILGYVYTTGEVTRQFGQPSSALSSIQQVTYPLQLYFKKDELIRPADSGGSPRPFRVDLGESVNSIALRLENNGFIPNAESFRMYLIYAGLDTKLQAGEYELNPAVPPLEIAKQLLDATPGEVTFQILPGWRVEEIAASLPTSGLSISTEAFLTAVQQVDPSGPLAQIIMPEGTMEGFLYPDSYRFAREIDVNQFLATVSENFLLKVTPEMRDAYSRQGLSLYQAVTLASIVQREAMVEEEQPMIASVFFNRLNGGMKLDSDPTVQYALGFDQENSTWWTNPLSLNDLQFDSPYNTYIYTGLPPSPIANPGLSALRAVAYPAQTPYFYFRARCDGSGRHEFSETFEEHVQNGCSTP